MAAAKHDDEDEDVADDVADDDGVNDADDNADDDDMCVPRNLDPGVPRRQSFS